MILNHKTVLFLGSSVTFGVGETGLSFADMMVDTCGIRMVKEAVCGTTLTDRDSSSYVARLKTVDVSLPVDLFICQLSTNDAWQGMPIDGVEAAIRSILDYVKETWGCPIVFYTGTWFDNELYERMVTLLLHLQEELGKDYCFTVLDLWHDPDMLAVTPEEYARYMSDPVHPNEKGYREWWLPKFMAFCEGL